MCSSFHNAFDITETAFGGYYKICSQGPLRTISNWTRGIWRFLQRHILWSWSCHGTRDRIPRKRDFSVRIFFSSDIFQSHETEWTSQVVFKVLRGTSVERKHIEQVCFSCSLNKRINSNDVKQRLDREFITWTSLQHRHVAEFLGIAHVFDGRAPVMVSRFLRSPDILAYIERYPYLKLDKVISIRLSWNFF